MMSSKQKKIFFAVVKQFALGDTLFHNHRCWYRPSIAKKKKKSQNTIQYITGSQVLW